MNHFRGVPVLVSLSRRMKWETVSNAAVRSSRMRITSEPRSAARSSVILMMAVSVLWQGQEARLKLFRKSKQVTNESNLIGKIQ